MIDSLWKPVPNHKWIITGSELQGLYLRKKHAKLSAFYTDS